MIKLINFTELTRQQIEEVFVWRNHPFIRENMINKEEIPFEKHLSFMQSLQGDNFRLYFYLQGHKGGVGVFDLVVITQTSAVFGCYKNPFLTERGIGSIIMEISLDYSFHTLGLETLTLEVYRTNTVAIRLYKKTGFVVYDETDTLLKMRLDHNV